MTFLKVAKYTSRKILLRVVVFAYGMGFFDFQNLLFDFKNFFWSCLSVSKNTYGTTILEAFFANGKVISEGFFAYKIAIPKAIL